MADSIPAAVLRNLSDKLYDKRKNAALEIEAIVRKHASVGDHHKVTAVIKLLNDFISSTDINYRLGGILGLAGVTFGLKSELAVPRIQDIVQPIIISMGDEDSMVRYHACEALYNIAKIVREDLILFFNQIFDALCKLSADLEPNTRNAAGILNTFVKDIVAEAGNQFSMEEFVPLLRERMHVLDPFVRLFLVGWIYVLDGVPDIDVLSYLPDFLDGLLNMLSDPRPEIRQQVGAALSEFLQEIKNPSFKSVDYSHLAKILIQKAASPDELIRLTAITWINELVKLGEDHLIPYYADILGVVLPCITDEQEKIRVLACETNKELHAIRADPAEGFDVGAILSTAQRHLSSGLTAIQIEALHWISVVLKRFPSVVLCRVSEVSETLSKALSSPSDEAVLLVMEVYSCIAKDQIQFSLLMVSLLKSFQTESSLLEKRGVLIIRQLCVHLDAKEVYLEMSSMLERETDLDFAFIMVQALNYILLSSPVLSDLRNLLKQSLVNADGKDLLLSLYASWCHSPMSIISLCLLAQDYQHAYFVIQSLVEEDITVRFLVELDKFIHLLETPAFAHLRLQLLEPRRYVWLLKALYSLLMLLPQRTSAYKILSTRLQTVPLYSCNCVQFHEMSLEKTSPSSSRSQIYEKDEVISDSHNVQKQMNHASRLQQLGNMLQQHRLHSKSKAQALKSSASSSKVQEVQMQEDPSKPEMILARDRMGKLPLKNSR